jgi:hypothetical protein
VSKPVQIKVNVSGSWASLVVVSPARLGEVQASCVDLAARHLGQIAFKAICGDTGATLSQFESPAKPGRPHGWYSIN